MTTSLFVWGHEAAFLAYAIFAAIVGIRGARTPQSLLFLLMMLATAVWAQSFVAVFLGFAPDWLERVSSAVRDAAWLALSLGVMRRHGGDTGHSRTLVTAAAVLSVLQIALSINNAMIGTVGGVSLDVTLVRIMMTILGFVIFENVIRNSSKAEL